MKMLVVTQHGMYFGTAYLSLEQTVWDVFWHSVFKLGTDSMGCILAQRI